MNNFLKYSNKDTQPHYKPEYYKFKPPSDNHIRLAKTKTSDIIKWVMMGINRKT